MPVIVDFI